MSERVRVLGGRYRVEDLLGRGGMAEVYRGTDTVLGRPVAIKILNAQYAKDPGFVQRFRREAQAAAKLNRPNVVGVYDTGSDDGTHYIVMEFVEGRTLADFMAKGGRLMPERSIELTEAVCRALTAAHSAGIVHRDVKPGNVMVTRAGEVKVMDFGIARAASAETVTETATVLGTASYLSPEQAQGQAVDARTDIYSLGIVLYEMLAGRVPFTGDSAVAVAYKHVQEVPVVPSQHNADVPPELDSVVMRALAKNPDNRYQTAEEFRQDLERVRRGQPVAATPILPGTQTQVIHRGGPPTAVLPAEPPRRSRWRWLWVPVVLLILGGIGTGLFFLAKNLLVSTANQVKVPKVTGLTEDGARLKLQARNLKLGQITRQVHPSVGVGTIFKQSPPANDQVAEHSEVDVWVAKAPPTVEVPDLTGDTIADARSELTDANLALGNRSEEASDRKVGTIIDQSPPPHDEVPAGTSVDVTVSSGPELATVPDVVCKPIARARFFVEQEGLTLVESGNTEFNPDCPHPGKVASQTPAALTQVRAGSSVTVDETENQPTPTPTGT